MVKILGGSNGVMGGGQGVGARNQAEEAWRSRISPAIELGREEEMAEVEEEEDGRRNIYLKGIYLVKTKFS